MFAPNINYTTHTLHDEPIINLVCDELFLWRSCFNRNCASKYSESLYSRIHIRIRHPVFAIRIVFVTWCIRSSPTSYKEKLVNLKKKKICCFYFQLEKYVFVPQVFNF